MQVMSFALVLGAPFCDRRVIAVMSIGEIGRASGLVLFAIGMVLTTWSEAKLGRLFSTEVTTRKGYALVTDGLYRYLRHPRYLGIILFSAGIGLVFRSWLAMALAALSTAVLVWRIRDEEALLRDEFGRGWDAYARRSWRLVPFVY
jgi:protein-S-isoprenylcysteine O-methyltransferase Ste14